MTENLPLWWTRNTTSYVSGSWHLQHTRKCQGEGSPILILLERYKTRYGSDAQNVLPRNDGDKVEGGMLEDSSALSSMDEVDLGRTRVRTGAPDDR